MESFREENGEEKKFSGDAKDIVRYEKIKNLARERYCFNPTAKVSESKKDLGDLARMEKYTSSNKESSDWGHDKELRRCQLRKNLLVETLNSNSRETGNFWLRLERFFCEKFDEKINKEKKHQLPPLKRRTYLDEEEGNDNKNEEYSREAREAFKSLKNGIESEKIINEVFRKVLGAETRITNSEIDIRRKIDSFVFAENAILMLQIKTKISALMEKNKTEIIQEVNFDVEELEKKKFYEGYKETEKELGLENKDKVLVKGIWVTIPTEWKTGKGNGYDERLEIAINEWCLKNGIKKVKGL